MRVVLCAVYVLVGALLFAVPNLSPRELLFAVPVPADFRESRDGQHAISVFRAVIAAVVLAGVCALLLSPAKLLNAIEVAMPIAIVLAGGTSFYWQHRKLAAAAVQFARPREAELTTTPEELPRFAWLAAGPFVILGAAALLLYLNWSRIPARYPVHWGADGQPNRWVDRTTKGMYGLLFFGAEFCAWVLIMALAGWFGSRRSRSRPVMLGCTIAFEYFFAFLFAVVAVQPLGIPVWVIALLPTAILIPIVAVMRNRMSGITEPMDPTPNECWKSAILYYNSNDAALFVQSRHQAFTYTFNFANPWSWVLLLGLALVLASAPFVIA